MPTQKKVDQISEMQEKVSKAKSMIFTDYTGLKHKQLEELRRSLAKVNAEFAVVKNKLFERALGDKASDVEEYLKKASGVLFAYGDEVAPLKEVKKFFKTANIGSTKGGLLGRQVLTDNDVNTLSALPSRDVLLGQLVGQMMAPVSGLHYALSWNINKLVWALNAVKSKKS